MQNDLRLHVRKSPVLILLSPAEMLLIFPVVQEFLYIRNVTVVACLLKISIPGGT